MIDWKFIKDTYPQTFRIFQFHENPTTLFYGWDVIDNEAENVGREDYEPDFQLRYVKGYNTTKPFYYDLQDKSYNDRKLYDFFDRLGIYIQVIPILYRDGVIWEWKLNWFIPKDKWLWYGTHDLDEDGKDYPVAFSTGTFSYDENNPFKTRREAETAVFTKAFEEYERKDINGIV
jgi:hypothetical protein